ncbi:MAG TPA: transposase [Gemmatimonadales bacterium]|jgi:transposase
MSSITIGLDLGDRYSSVCAVDAAGRIQQQARVRTTPEALRRQFTGAPARVIVEVGTHSPWVSRLLTELGHEVIVANARQLRLIYGSDRKSDCVDAEALARVGRLDVRLLAPIQHRSAQAQTDLAQRRARDCLVRARTQLINHVRGAVKAVGGRLPASSAPAFPRQVAAQVLTPLQPALQPLLALIEALTVQIHAAERALAQVALNHHCRAPRGLTSCV